MQHENISRGDKVGLRTNDGEILQRIVWDVHEKCVELCSERQYKWLMKGDGRATPICFRWKDIEVYEPRRK